MRYIIGGRHMSSGKKPTPKKTSTRGPKATNPDRTSTFHVSSSPIYIYIPGDIGRYMNTQHVLKDNIITYLSN